MYTLTIDGEERTMAIGDETSKSGDTFYELLMSTDNDGNYRYESDIDRIYSLYNSYLNPDPKNYEELKKKFPHLAYSFTDDEITYNAGDAQDARDKVNYLNIKSAFRNTNEYEEKLISGQQKLQNHLQYLLTKESK